MILAYQDSERKGSELLIHCFQQLSGSLFYLRWQRCTWTLGIRNSILENNTVPPDSWTAKREQEFFSHWILRLPYALEGLLDHTQSARAVAYNHAGWSKIRCTGAESISVFQRIWSTDCVTMDTGSPIGSHLPNRTTLSSTVSTSLMNTMHLGWNHLLCKATHCEWLGVRVKLDVPNTIHEWVCHAANTEQRSNTSSQWTLTYQSADADQPLSQLTCGAVCAYQSA
jgi:hypothetical protein